MNTIILAGMIPFDPGDITLRLKNEAGKVSVFDPFRRKWLLLTPEEHVRQYLARYLTEVMDYPKGMIALERNIQTGSVRRRFDLVIYDREHKPWMLVECKAPEVDITTDTLYQLLDYHRFLQCRYWVLCNGRQLFCADASEKDNIIWMHCLPGYG